MRVITRARSSLLCKRADITFSPVLSLPFNEVPFSNRIPACFFFPSLLLFVKFEKKSWLKCLSRNRYVEFDAYAFLTNKRFLFIDDVSVVPFFTSDAQRANRFWLREPEVVKIQLRIGIGTRFQKWMGEKLIWNYGYFRYFRGGGNLKLRSIIQLAGLY